MQEFLELWELLVSLFYEFPETVNCWCHLASSYCKTNRYTRNPRLTARHSTLHPRSIPKRDKREGREKKSCVFLCETLRCLYKKGLVYAEVPCHGPSDPCRIGTIYPCESCGYGLIGPRRVVITPAISLIQTDIICLQTRRSTGIFSCAGHMLGPIYNARICRNIYREREVVKRDERREISVGII